MIIFYSPLKRLTLDSDRSGDVNISEVEAFKESHLISKKIELGSYILIDEGDVPLGTISVEMEFENAQGDINITSPINVTTFVEYKLLSPIPSGEHELWILGHPLIRNMKITLPDGMAVVSSDGLENIDVWWKGCTGRRKRHQDIYGGKSHNIRIRNYR